MKVHPRIHPSPISSLPESHKENWKEWYLALIVPISVPWISQRELKAFGSVMFWKRRTSLNLTKRIESNRKISGSLSSTTCWNLTKRIESGSTWMEYSATWFSESHKENWKINSSLLFRLRLFYAESHKENWKTVKITVKPWLIEIESHKENWKSTWKRILLRSDSAPNLTKRIERIIDTGKVSSGTSSTESHKENWKMHIAQFTLPESGKTRISQRELKVYLQSSLYAEWLQYESHKENWKEKSSASLHPSAPTFKNLTKRIERWRKRGSLEANLHTGISQRELKVAALKPKTAWEMVESHKENWKFK